jgi:hypothetical protein
VSPPGLLRAASCLAALALLAGCLQPTTPTGATTGLSMAPWPGTLAGPGGDAESSLAVSPDGQTVLACSHGGFTQASPLWASTDGGATFRRVEVSPNQPFDGDCDVAIGADGSWNIVYDTVASATFASSQDQGKTWWVHPFAAEPFGGVDRPWILADGDGVILTWADVMAALPFAAFFTKTSDGGRTWTPHTLIGTFTPSEVNCFMAHPIAAPSHAIQVPIACKDGDDVLGSGPAYLLESADGGATWDKVPTGVRTGGSITASYAGDGGLWMTVDEADATGTRLGVARSTDGGRTFTTPLWLDGNVTPGFGWFWVDGRPDGSATAAWMDDADNSTGNGTGKWQVSVARLDFGGGAIHARLGRAGPIGDAAPLYEFLMVRHDASGRAYVTIPQITGPDCYKPGELPSRAGSGDLKRNQQCIYIAREPMAG